jgi:hypothetical protein
MKGYSDIQAEVGNKKYMTYAESHPKSYISVLIVQGMVNDLVQTLKDRNNFNGLDESLKNTKAGKSVNLLKSIPLLLVLLLPQLETQMNFRFCCPNPEGKGFS